MKVRSGHIPADITYLFGPTIEVSHKWDDAEQEDAELAKISVVPTFVSDTDNEKTLATGTRWAENRCQSYDYATGKTVKLAVPQKSQRENTPMAGVRIVALEHRGEGGRAYKVITPDSHYFDLREDVLLDAMLTEGISPGGILNGKFMFARVASEMKLIRFGSELFKALLEAGERSILSSIPKSELKVGGLYEGKQGARGLFLGFVTTDEYGFKWPNGKNTSHNQYLNRNSAYTKTAVTKPTLVSKKHSKHMLWLDIGEYCYRDSKVKNPTMKAFKEAMAKDQLDYSFMLRGSHSMVKHIEDFILPADIIEQVRIKAIFTLEQRIANTIKNSRSATWGSHHTNEQHVEEVCAASAICLMREVGNAAPTSSGSSWIDAVTAKLGQEVSV